MLPHSKGVIQMIDFDCHCNCHIYGDGFCRKCAYKHHAERTSLETNVKNRICCFCEKFVDGGRISHLRKEHNYKDKAFKGMVGLYYR